MAGEGNGTRTGRCATGKELLPYGKHSHINLSLPILLFALEGNLCRSTFAVHD
jgi:hypothetical protein